MLKKRGYKTPMQPTLEGEDDVRQFSTDFTNVEPEDKDVDPPAAKNAHNYFRGYSFVAPEWRSRSAQEVPPVDRPEPTSRPKLEEVLSAQKNVSCAMLYSLISLALGSLLAKVAILQEVPHWLHHTTNWRWNLLDMHALPILRHETCLCSEDHA